MSSRRRTGSLAGKQRHERFHSIRELGAQRLAIPSELFGYVEFFASASDQAINSLLDASRCLPKFESVDLCFQETFWKWCRDAAAKVSGVLLLGNAGVRTAQKHQRQPSLEPVDAQNLPLRPLKFTSLRLKLGVCHVPDLPPPSRVTFRRVLRQRGLLRDDSLVLDLKPLLVLQLCMEQSRPTATLRFRYPRDRISISLQDEVPPQNFWRTPDFRISR